MNEIILNKKISIERCIAQVRSYYAQLGDTSLHDNYLVQDAISMNLQRIGELAIDIANHLIKRKKLGLPQDSADAFVLLQSAGLISAPMLKNMKGMVGFRNILVHEYTKLDIGIMLDVIENHLLDPLEFADEVLRIME
jgi:uncharacterized protein YutE (UPF0331/DUF86 family)